MEKISSLAAGIPLLYICFFILVLIVRLAFAGAVASDAKKLAARGGGIFLVGPGMWGFATLIGGIWVVAIYWAIHHSNLRSSSPPWKKSNAVNSPRDPA